MTFRNTEYLILVSHESGTEEFAHMQISRVQVAADGTIFPAQPIDVQQADALPPIVQTLNVSIVKQNDLLKAQLLKQADDHTAEIDTINAAHTSAIQTLNSQIQSLTAQVANAQADAESNVAGQLTQLQSEKSALQARVETLLAELPYDPRKIKVDAFLRRLTETELLMLSEPNPTVQQIAGMLRQWKENNWPIYFDTSPEFAQAMGFLTQTGRLSAGRVAEITVDSSREDSPPITV